jgi:hypothetical protein
MAWVLSCQPRPARRHIGDGTVPFGDIRVQHLEAELQDRANTSYVGVGIPARQVIPARIQEVQLAPREETVFTIDQVDDADASRLEKLTAFLEHLWADGK